MCLILGISACAPPCCPLTLWSGRWRPTSQCRAICVGLDTCTRGDLLHAPTGASVPCPELSWTPGRPCDMPQGAARKAVPPHARPSPLAPRPCTRLLCPCVCWPGRRSCAWTVASTACPTGDPLSIATLIKAGCDTTTKVNNGQAGLMHAAASGNAAAVQVVLALGNLQLDARDRDEDTAFLAACGTGDPESIADQGGG